ncbi:MAG: ribonuclease HII [Saprospiraceae bacterium]
MALIINHSGKLHEAGCDEAGRGCLAGPVFAAAVILPPDFFHPDLNDSKKLTDKKRYELREIIENESLAWSVARLDAPDIDKYNILWASVRAMHKALDKIKIKPEHILVDGNKFKPYKEINYDCIVKGDGIYTSIAAASILAKTFRDDYMLELHHKYPDYQWNKNKGYPTEKHRSAIVKYGPCEFHRKSFQLYPSSDQLSLF